MRGRTALLAALCLSGCESEGTVNNDHTRLAFTTRVSTTTAGQEIDGLSSDARLSGDGRRVAFRSLATNLHPDDRDTVEDIFVKDLPTGQVYLASRQTGPAGAKATASSFSPRLSHDGRRVVFYSYGRLDASADSDNAPDVYVRDLETHQTILVSRAAGPAGVKGNYGGVEADISPDGGYVAFASSSTNLTLDDADGIQDIFVRELASGSIELVSRASGVSGSKANNTCQSPQVSTGGVRVAFFSNASSIGQSLVCVRDRPASLTIIASRADGSTGIAPPNANPDYDMSPDGRFVAFSSNANTMDPDDSDSLHDIFLRDLQRETTILVSRASGARGEDATGQCSDSSVSADGRFVSFTSTAGNLVPGDENTIADVFLRDTAEARTFRVSLRTFGGEATGASSISSLSADGSSVAFLSLAAQLVEDDGNNAEDVFVRGPLW